MNIVLLRKVASQLETNLKIISESLNFVGNLTEEDLTPPDANYPLHSALDSIRQSLIAYIVFDKNVDKLKHFAREHSKKHSGGNVLFAYSLPKPLNFNEKADRILKEVDAHLKIVSDMLSINLPRPYDNRQFGKYPSINDWGYDERKNLTEAMNIVRVAKSIVSE